MRKLALLLVLSVVAGFLVAGVVFPPLGGLGLAFDAGGRVFRHLPDELGGSSPPERSVMLDAHGGTIATFYREDRVDVPLTQVAPVMRKAIVAIEDARYYQHGAIDVKGTLRALVEDLTGHSIQGGSTLTQQYVKMVQLERATTRQQAQAATARSGVAGFARKLKELRLAAAVEDKYSKDDILQRYLDIAYFGDGAYGVEAAARHYFSVPASSLDLPRAALLAGLVRSPYAYDPVLHPASAKARRDTVLRRMAETRAIPWSTADAAMHAPLGLQVSTQPDGCAGAPAGEAFFCQYVADDLLADPAFGSTYQNRLDLLYGGGLTIHTTLDPKAQTAATVAMHHHVWRTSPIVGSLVSVQPGTGAVRALAVSRDYTTARRAGRKELNFDPAVDSAHGGGNGAQYGSTAKAFTLAAALQHGIPLSHVIDAPGSMPWGTWHTCGGARVTPTGVVHNAAGESEHGSMNLVDGTVKSVNTFFVKLEHEVGMCAAWRTARKLGMVESATGRPLGEHPSLTLGADSVDPLHVASAYATFAAGGTYCRPDPYESVLDGNGHPMAGLGRQCSQVLSAHAAAGVVTAMKGVLTRGTAAGNGIGRPAAGKTGTTDHNAAGWFTGYTPDLATSVSLASPTSTQAHPLKGANLGPRTATGFGVDAAPLWREMMVQALQGTQHTTFPAG